MCVDEPIESLVGIGVKSGSWLREAGVGSREELERVGVVEAYVRVREMREGVSLNLLWALQGGLMGVHWSMVSPGLRARLMGEVEARDGGGETPGGAVG